jgi:hypothetical protein
MNPSRVPAALFAAAAALCALAACGGAGSSSTPPTTNGGSPPPTAPPVTSSASVVTAEEDWINGDNGWYTSGSASWSNHAGDTSSSPNGSSSVDGMSCGNVTEGTSYPQSAFSQHVFVGIFNNGAEEALPQALGMVNPVAPTQGTPQHPTNSYEVENNQCEYNVHTHDYSGLVHIEDTTLPQSNTAFPAYANLQSLFDVWGAQLSATGITAGSSSMTGAVTIYAGTPSGKDSSGNDLVTTYTPFSGAPSALQFSKHMAIWIVVGTPPASGLPQVRFVIEN